MIYKNSLWSKSLLEILDCDDVDRKASDKVGLVEHEHILSVDDKLELLFKVLVVDFGSRVNEIDDDEQTGGAVEHDEDDGQGEHDPGGLRDAARSLCRIELLLRPSGDVYALNDEHVHEESEKLGHDGPHDRAKVNQVEQGLAVAFVSAYAKCVDDHSGLEC
jgi:hypothetical protein